MDCLSFLKARINKKVYLTSKDKILHKYVISVDEEKATVTTITNLVSKHTTEQRKDMNGNNVPIHEINENEKPTTFKLKLIDNYFDYYLKDCYFAKHTGNLKGLQQPVNQFNGSYNFDIETVNGPFILFEKEVKYNSKKQYSLIGTLTNQNNVRVYITSIESSDFLHNRTIEQLNALVKT